MIKNLSLHLPILYLRRIKWIILLSATLIFLGTFSIVLAQGGLIGNPGFETGDPSGNHLPPWQKWGYPISNVQAISCCSHSGTWSAWVEPKGKYVELQQNISVTTRRTYELTAWVYTYGALNAQVGWWSNAINSTVCASTTSTSYGNVPLYCQLNIPDNTTAFNVHLGGNAPAGNGALTDDWSLTLKTSTGAVSQAFSQLPVSAAGGVKAYIWTAQQPAGYWFIASPVGICTSFPCSGNPGFAETGYNKGTNSVPPKGLGANILQQYVSWKYVNGSSNGDFTLLALADNTWYNMGVEYRSGLNRWVAFVSGVLEYLLPADLNFQSGSMVSCGAEGKTTQYTGGSEPLGVQCDIMQYQPVGQSYISYDYNNVQIDGNYCVYKPRQYGAIGWGLCWP